jgi:hypothetical protein
MLTGVPTSVLPPKNSTDWYTKVRTGNTLNNLKPDDDNIHLSYMPLGIITLWQAMISTDIMLYRL